MKAGMRKLCDGGGGNTPAEGDSLPGHGGEVLQECLFTVVRAHEDDLQPLALQERVATAGGHRNKREKKPTLKYL